jgi:hypothetical protein
MVILNRLRVKSTNKSKSWEVNMSTSFSNKKINLKKIKTHKNLIFSRKLTKICLKSLINTLKKWLEWRRTNIWEKEFSTREITNTPCTKSPIDCTMLVKKLSKTIFSNKQLQFAKSAKKIWISTFHNSKGTSMMEILKKSKIESTSFKQKFTINNILK